VPSEHEVPEAHCGPAPAGQHGLPDAPHLPSLLEQLEEEAAMQVP
jgi:hypothetical protein